MPPSAAFCRRDAGAPSKTEIKTIRCHNLNAKNYAALAGMAPLLAMPGTSLRLRHYVLQNSLISATLELGMAMHQELRNHTARLPISSFPSPATHASSNR